MSVAERSRAMGLRTVTRLAGSEVLDRVRMRKPVERALYRASKGGFRVAVAAGRTFSAASKLGSPARQPQAKSKGLFDLTPDDEQKMLCDAIADFAASTVRPAALAADNEASTPKELLGQAAELGLGMLGIPEELGGVMAERSATTAVLAGEALAHGDMGIAFAALAPGAVASAIGLWGDAEQQASYLPSFTGEDPPVAALALLEPTPLFDPLAPAATARRAGGDWLLSGVKSLVPRAAEGELVIVGARTDAGTPGLFVLEGGGAGLMAEGEPAMGLRPASTARLVLEDVRVPSSALLAEGDPGSYGECVQRARLGWCALSVGCAKAVLDYVVPYVKDRVAFGEPVSNRQAVAFAVADIAIELEGMRLATWRAASRADQGKGFVREVALARTLCSQKGMKIGADGVQLLGGHGYVKEHPVERWYRDLRAAGLMEGALLV
ncbi:MAG: acyl-CoA dehydrogenase family protein [Acidobacteriota bacterium]|nr:acyl-CoA dehydrogenase family protein [Acidobacteriota bacterium]